MLYKRQGYSRNQKIYKLISRVTILFLNVYNLYFILSLIMIFLLCLSIDDFTKLIKGFVISLYRR